MNPVTFRKSGKSHYVFTTFERNDRHTINSFEKSCHYTLYTCFGFTSFTKCDKVPQPIGQPNALIYSVSHTDVADQVDFSEQLPHAE